MIDMEQKRKRIPVQARIQNNNIIEETATVYLTKSQVKKQPKQAFADETSQEKVEVLQYKTPMHSLEWQIKNNKYEP